jgi:negative regulator of replication initiation
MLKRYLKRSVLETFRPTLLRTLQSLNSDEFQEAGECLQELRGMYNAEENERLTNARVL